MGFFYGAFGTTWDRTSVQSHVEWKLTIFFIPKRPLKTPMPVNYCVVENLKALEGKQTKDPRDQMFYVFGNFPFDLCLPSIQCNLWERQGRLEKESYDQKQYLRSEFLFEAIIQVVIALERRAASVSASFSSSVNEKIKKQIIQHEILHHRCFVGCCCK